VSASGGNGKPIVFHIGFVTPAGDYAAVEESDGPQAGYLVTLLGKTPKGLGDVRVGAVSWRSVRGADGRLALIRPSSPPSVVVTGTAALPELVTLAVSLR
jgi:hypothetical protein